MKPVLAILAAALIAGFAPSASGQDWDNTGNHLLAGDYNFREVRWVTSNGNLTSAVSRFGTINFTGTGSYSIAGTTNTGAAYVVTNATYSMSLGGFGFLNPPASETVLGRVYGLVSNGVFIGSSTESGVNNLFIAARKSPVDVTTATFNQSFTLVYTDLAGFNSNQIRDAVIPIFPNGTGGVPATTATGFAGLGAEQTQSIPSASYSFSGGVGTLNFGSSGQLISGSKQLYVANGGQFVFGGSTTGWDMFVGIRTPTTSVPDSAFTGLYFQAGMDIDRSVASPVVNSYFGAFNAAQSLHKIVGHQRLQAAPDAPYEYTYGDDYTLGGDGSYDDFLDFRNYVSSDGGLKIGFGRVNYLGINVSLKAPVLSQPGVFLNPNGVVNAGSYSPFTVGISPGELLTLFGTNLAPSGTNLQDSNFPASLGGVSVTINGVTAPIYIARGAIGNDPGGLAVLVPYSIALGSTAEIVVNNNGSSSNRVTAFVNETSPGFFATPVPNGTGYVAARHASRLDFIVSADDPVVPGEYIAIFLTGLGAVNPPITAGQAGPVNPLSLVTSNIDAAIDGTQITGADFNFKGIAPILHGAYQINLRVPNDARSGDLYLDLGGPDTLNSQIQIPVRRPGASALSLTRQSRSRPQMPHASASTRRGLGETSNSSPSRGR